MCKDLVIRCKHPASSLASFSVPLLSAKNILRTHIASKISYSIFHRMPNLGEKSIDFGAMELIITSVSSYFQSWKYGLDHSLQLYRGWHR